MPFEGRQRAAALDRCWSIYLSLTRVFILPEEFHVEFPVAAESVLITLACSGCGGHRAHRLRFNVCLLREETWF